MKKIEKTLYVSNDNKKEFDNKIDCFKYEESLTRNKSKIEISMVIIFSISFMSILGYLIFQLYMELNCCETRSFLNSMDSFSSHNLGKMLALIGLSGTLVSYMTFESKKSILFFGVTISLFSGYMVEISDTFYQSGVAG